MSCNTKLNTYPDSEPINLCCVLTGEETNTNFIVFGVTRSWLEPMIYHT